MAEQNEPKKVIIDEDWKNQAQKEKEVLEKKVEQEVEEKVAPPDLPPADFEGLVSFFATQAYFALGLIRSKEDKDKQIAPDLEAARYHIDMLSLLEQKCKGNLTGEEQQLLQGTLSQLRMLFVNLSKQG
jgi:hypothetical protein